MTNTPIQKDLITVIGPTATGKTSFAVALAKELNSEIISADSRQVYRGMDIGTGKDIKDFTVDGCKIPYHLIDIIDAGEKYNIFKYQSDFLKAYNSLREKNIIPVLCGGSGMYVESVLKGYKLIDVPTNLSLRNEFFNSTIEELTIKLREYGSLHNKSDIDTRERAIRAIEIANYYQDNNIDLSFPSINTTIFGIKFNRNVVKERVTLRLKQRLRDGMIDEVKELLKNGIPKKTLEYYGLEYKYISQFLNKEYSYNNMVEKLNIAIHQFSKRQMTWFRKMERQGFQINWIDGDLSMNDKIGEAMTILKQ